MDTSRWDKIYEEASCLRPVIDCWSIIGDIDRDTVGVSDTEIDKAEQLLSRKLTVELRALYQISNGLSLLAGNLEIVPLFGESEDFGLTNYSNLLRKWDWPVPDELIIFGGNGSSDVLGIWLPKDSLQIIAQPVVMLGEVFEPRCMAIVGTSLCNFLRVWSAYYTYDNADSLDALGVPPELRNFEEDDALLAALYAWGDPAIPNCIPDPYTAGLISEEINEICAKGFTSKQHTIPALTPKKV